jgi:plasmid stabilization system protein ParE
VVKWALTAKNDLHAIHEYIALDSKFYAKNTIRNIIEKTKIIEESPEIGRIVPEFEDEEIREVFMYSYRIIYQIQHQSIVILTIIHGSRDLFKAHIPSII